MRGQNAEISIYFLNNKNNYHFCYKNWRGLSVELAALHAAAKNIINLTARTDGMYGGRTVLFSPSTASTVCGVLRSTAAVSRSKASVDSEQSRGSTQHATTILMGLIS